ncbi:MAG: copper-binding protein [Ramlibacter sp.]
MKPLQTVATAIAIVLSAPFAGAHAQGMMNHGTMGGMSMPGMKMESSAAAEMTEGEVRKIDRDNQKITLRHGALKNLDMPGMTMVFGVRDAAMLSKVQVGSKIHFMAEKTEGGLVVTAIEVMQ